MTTLFLDTSALVKHYRTEQGTSRVDALFQDRENALTISELTLVELVSALQRLKNNGEISDEAMAEAIDRFDEDTNERFAIVNLSRALLILARSIVRQHGLRPLDAIQLASLLRIKDEMPILVAADSNLLQAAQANGLQTLNPLEEVKSPPASA